MIEKLTKSELQVMNLLWKTDRPLSCSEIVELSDDKTWKDSYVHMIIKSLMKKKAIDIAAFELVSRSYARKFTPAISYNQYVLMSAFSDTDLHDADKMTGFFKEFLEVTSSAKLKENIKKIVLEK